MKRAIFIIILFVFAVCFTSDFSYAEGGITGNINFLIGTKALEGDDWEPLDSQTEYGINLDFGITGWPIHVDIAYFSSSDDQEFYEDEYIIWNYVIEASTKELRLGAKYIWDATPTMRPYIAGGLSSIKAKMEHTEKDYGFHEGFTFSEDDSAVGYYIAGGLYWTLAGHFNLGAQLGYSKASIELLDEAGGTHALVLIGFHY